MKVILDLEKYTVEYLETTPFIQGTDSRNKIEVLVPHESTTNVMIAYTLASGRSTIAMANKSLTTITYNSASYDNVLFELPSTVTRLEGNICATVIVTLASDSTKHKFNILNTILNSTDFETFEDALTGIAAQVLASLAAMNSNLSSMSTNLNNHTGNTNNPHSVTKAQVGLGNCNNTSDKDKPISDATQAALDDLQDEIDDLGVIAEMPDKIIDVANCFDFTNNKDKVTVDKVETKELKVTNYEDPYNTRFSVDENGIIAHQNDDDDYYAEFEVSGPSLGTLAAFKFKWGSEFGDNVITLADILNMAQGKTSNYVIDTTATGTNITNFEFDNVANTITLDLLDDGNENKLKLVNNTIVSFKDLKIGDIVSVIQNDASDRWVGNITSTTVTFYALETKTDSTPTQNSGNPISSNAIWNIISNGANANTWHSENTFQGTTELHDVRVEDELLLSDNVEFSVQDFKKIRDRSRDKTLQDSLDQNLYNLGAFDSVSGNVITRQTGYLKLSDTRYFEKYNESNGYYAYRSNISFEDAVANLTKVASFDSSNMTQECYQEPNNTVLYIAVLPTNIDNVVIQYKLATPYTEQVIENQPLITLDQKGSEWLRNEWEKGLNIWDEQWESGTYNTNGEKTSYSGKIRNVNFIEVKPNTTYYIHCGNADGLNIWEYNSSKASVDFSEIYNNNTITTTSNTKYINFSTFGTGFSSYNNNFMIVEGTHAYPYQAYNGAIIHEKDITPVLLWENGNPNSIFSSASVTTLDSSSFKYIVVAYKYSNSSSDANVYVKIKNEASKTAPLMSANQTYYDARAYRYVVIDSSTQVTFGDGYYTNLNTTNSVDNNALIPIAIYGTNVL